MLPGVLNLNPESVHVSESGIFVSKADRVRDK